MLDHRKLAEKWQDFWKKNKVFESDPDKRKPFYIQVAYPYPSGAMHIGHARTYTVADAVAKYHRLKGENALMPMGWHVSGTPVIAAVEAIKNKDKQKIKMFTENFHIPKKDIIKLTTPKGFVNYMIDEAEYGYKKGFQLLGLGIDWRRELTTIDKHYQKFIEWQYKILDEKGYLKKGKYPVRFCPSDNHPVGDHDLSKGEGIGLKEYTLLKLRLKGEEKVFIVAATLRPETIYGQTNVWVNPSVTYAKVACGSEIWIVSKSCAKKLAYQMDVQEKGEIKAKDLIGKMVCVPGRKDELPILPSPFPDQNIATGIVTSVPSDAPYDYIALKQLKDNPKELKLYGLSIEKINPISIIHTGRFGDFAAKKACEEYNIDSLSQKEKLEEATAAVYKVSFHTGTLTKDCGKYAGLQVVKAKEAMKKDLLTKNEAALFYELEGEVVCRCGTTCLVSVLDDQWFITYSNKEWKKESKKTLKDTKIIPGTLRTQYENVFDWLEDKPCTRTKGLGTSFPKDKTKIIEPLSDSTVYMAYFTIAHFIKKADDDKLTPQVFDYIFKNKGNVASIAKHLGIKELELKRMQESFQYWYPLGLNASAVELIPNHMSYSIFHHTALFPKEKRQQGTLNLGMVLLENQKMSSSKGNVILINDICSEIGADLVRLFLMISVEPWEEMDWRQGEIEKGQKNVKALIETLYDSLGAKGSKREASQDKWFNERFQSRINNYHRAMENLEVRKALQEIVFEFIKDLRWYERRGASKGVIGEIAPEWAKLIAPFMPHIAEELWQKAGNKKSVFEEVLPNKKSVDQNVLDEEEAVRTLLADIAQIKELTKIERPKELYIYTIPPEKRKYAEAALFLEKEVGAKVIVFDMAQKDVYDPQSKAKKAKKGRPAIFLVSG